MSNNKIIRAWKDPAYRNSLSQAELAALPANPAGSIEISDADLGSVAGGLYNFTVLGCTVYCNTVICYSHPCETVTYCRQ